MFNVESLLQKLENLPASTFIVGFYIRNTDVHQQEWMVPLAEHLNSSGFITFGLLDTD